MKKSPKHILSAIFVLAAVPAHAAVVFVNGYTGTNSEVSSTTDQNYAGDVSASDLLDGITPTTSGWNTIQNASPLELTDGIHGVLFAEVVGDNVQGAWTTVGATATYDLGTGANGFGYDITSLQSIADWENVNFGRQAWTLAVRTVGGGFEDVATINYQPVLALDDDGGSTKVTLSALNISGIEALRVTANEVNGGVNDGAFVWRELDVYGAATIPEPSSFALLAGMLGLTWVMLRRRK